MFEKAELDARSAVLARITMDRHRLKSRFGSERRTPVVAPSFGSRRRDSIEGYVVCVELDEATVMAEGGQFAFQTPAEDLKVGQRVRFVREGDAFSLV